MGTWFTDCVFQSDTASLGGHDIFILLQYGVSQPYEPLFEGIYTKTDQSNRLVVAYWSENRDTLNETAHDEWLPTSPHSSKQSSSLSITYIILIIVIVLLSVAIIVFAVLAIILYRRKHTEDDGQEYSEQTNLVQ